MPKIAGMRTSEVVEHYGSQKAIADALDIKQPSVAEWGDYPPPLRQIQIEKLTRRKLKAEPECYGTAGPKEEARAT